MTSVHVVAKKEKRTKLHEAHEEVRYFGRYGTRLSGGVLIRVDLARHDHHPDEEDTSYYPESKFGLPALAYTSLASGPTPQISRLDSQMFLCCKNARVLTFGPALLSLNTYVLH